MSIDERAHRTYQFGEFSLDLDRQTLARGDREIHLRPKSFTVLRILLEHPGRLVTKAMLHDAAWKGSVVTDDSLAHCIADIRRCLGENGFAMIRTVPRRGYIFERAVSQDLVGRPRVADENRRPPFRVAVIAVALLSATALLIGAGSRDTGTDRSNADDDASRPQTVMRSESLHDNMHAHNEYQRGRFFFSRRGDGDLDRAEASFKEALELNPSFGEAWTGLAGVYSVRYGNGDLSLEHALPLLGEATRFAVTLTPESAEAHVRRAFYYHVAGERMDAQRHFDTAMALAPNDVLVLGVRAGQLAYHGRFDEAIELQMRAIRGDPTSALLHHNLVWYLLAAGRIAEAAVQAGHYRALSPSSVNERGDVFVDVLILQGKHQQALAPTHSIVSNPKRNRSLAMIYHELGQSALADAALTRLMADEDELAVFYVAEVLAQRGDMDQAIASLSGVITASVSDTPRQQSLRRSALSLLSPYLIELRSDKRWQALYAQVLEAYEDQNFVARASVEPVTAPR